MVLPYTPLGLLPLDAAYIAWAGVQAVLLVAIAAMLLRGIARDWTRIERLGLVASLVAFPAVAMAFYQGAFALVLVVGVLGAVAAMDQRRDLGAGGLLALASVKPQGMFGMGVAVLLARRPAALAALVGWGLGLVALATVVLGPGIWASYLRFLGTYASSFDRLSANPSVMWNLRGTLALLLGRDNAAAVDRIAYAGFVIGVYAIALLWRRGWRRGGGGTARTAWTVADRASSDGTARTARLGLRVALTIVLTLLLSPHLNPHDDALAIVAVALAYGSLRGTTAGLAIGIGALLAPVAIVRRERHHGRRSNDACRSAFRRCSSSPSGPDRRVPAAAPGGARGGTPGDHRPRRPSRWRSPGARPLVGLAGGSRVLVGCVRAWRGTPRTCGPWTHTGTWPPRRPRSRHVRLGARLPLFAAGRRAHRARVAASHRCRRRGVARAQAGRARGWHRDRDARAGRLPIASWPASRSWASCPSCTTSSWGTSRCSCSPRSRSWPGARIGS